jgi:hypothetical protein
MAAMWHTVANGVRGRRAGRSFAIFCPEGCCHATFHILIERRLMSEPI